MPKIFVNEPFCALLQKISGSENVYVNEGGVVKRFSVENFLTHGIEESRWVNP